MCARDSLSDVHYSSFSGLMRRLRGLHGEAILGSEQGTSVESLLDVDTCDRKSMDDASTISTDDRSDLTGDRDLSFSYCHDAQLDDSASFSDGSSALGWPLGGRRDEPSSAASSKMGSGHNSTFMWEEKREKRETELSGWNYTSYIPIDCVHFASKSFFKEGGSSSLAVVLIAYRYALHVWTTEVEMMKERFAKLLLGEDMSGGAKGVSTALAISNAITNLSGEGRLSIFGSESDNSLCNDLPAC